MSTEQWDGFSVKQQFHMFARYNTWANARVYDAALQLSDADYRASKGAFFGSLHGTLNHLLVADRIWMHRFTGDSGGVPVPARLDAILFEQLDDLHAARRVEDLRIEQFVEALSDAQLAGFISYSRVSTPEPQRQALAPALAHFFNHQTHHRGQAHALLTMLAGQAPALDLLFYQRLAAAGQVH